MFGDPHDIDKLTVFITSESGEEGIISHVIPPLGCVPFIGSRPKTIAFMEKMAQEIANEKKIEIKKIEFTTRREIKTIKPK